LWGQYSTQGHWYYFPAIAAYKIPIGLGLVLALGVLSLFKKKFTWNEWALIIPIAVWSLLLVRTRINIGFRHFLPPYFFMILWASRSVAIPSRAWLGAAAAGLVAAAVHVAMWFPDFLPYMNAPREKWYLAMTDSNIDWGQGLRELGPYLDAHPPTAESPVYIWYNGSMPRELQWDIPNRRWEQVGFASLNRPTRGRLILGQTCLMGLIDRRDPFFALRDRPADAVIGRSMLVWDLGKLGPGFRWPPLSPVAGGATATQPAENMTAENKALLSLYEIK
jgi:hypothetical protein